MCVLKVIFVSLDCMLLLSMDFLSDFEMMLQRKKSMSGKRRRNRDGGTFISDADDVVSAMIVKMNEAAEVSWLTSSFTFLPLLIGCMAFGGVCFLALLVLKIHLRYIFF